MSFGNLEYDEDGKVKCEVCGQYFDRVVAHVRQKHSMNEREYKDLYGFDRSYGICSKRSKEKSRIKVFENYNKCIQKNLIQGGVKTRFENGWVGRVNISEQTRIRLSKMNVLENVKQSRINSGYKHGQQNLIRYIKATD